MLGIRVVWRGASKSKPRSSFVDSAGSSRPDSLNDIELNFQVDMIDSSNVSRDGKNG